MLNMKHRGLDAMRNLVPPGAIPCRHAFREEHYVCTQAVPCHLLRSHQPLRSRAIFPLAHSACRKTRHFSCPSTRKRLLSLYVNCSQLPRKRQSAISIFNITPGGAHEVKLRTTAGPSGFGLLHITTTACHPVTPM